MRRQLRSGGYSRVGGSCTRSATTTTREPPLIVAYQGHPKYIELSAARFEAYLREEGLESIPAERTRRGESGSPGRELFSRHAKSFLAPEGHVASKSSR